MPSIGAPSGKEMASSNPKIGRWPNPGSLGSHDHGAQGTTGMRSIGTVIRLKALAKANRARPTNIARGDWTWAHQPVSPRPRRAARIRHKAPTA